MEGCFQSRQRLAKGAAILIEFSDGFHSFGVAFGFRPVASLRSEAEALTNIRNEIADAGNNSFRAELEAARHEGADAHKDREFGMISESSQQLFEPFRIIFGVL